MGSIRRCLVFINSSLSAKLPAIMAIHSTGSLGGVARLACFFRCHESVGRSTRCYHVLLTAIDQSESPRGYSAFNTGIRDMKSRYTVLCSTTGRNNMSLSNQSHRIFFSLLQKSSRFATVSRSRTPQTWVRAITTKPATDAPSISFGPDADAVLSKYIKKPLNREEKVNKDPASEIESSSRKEVEQDDFEIQDFVDRSAPQATASAQEDAIDSTDLEERPRKKKKGKSGELSSKKPKKSADASQQVDAAKPRQNLEEWQAQKQALKEKFAGGWTPRKKLSPDAMEGIRGLNQQDPIKYSTAVLAQQFKVSPEAIRRILKSKWLSRSGSEKMDEKRERFAKRHDKIWDQQAELGLRPKRTKDMHVEHPDQFEHDMERRRILREI